MLDHATYAGAVTNLRSLLREVGRREFRAFGYASQLRRYRAAMRSLRAGRAA